MGKIVKVTTGRPGRPPNVEIHGGKDELRNPEPKVLGAQTAHDNTQTVSVTETKSEPQEVEVRRHASVIVEGEGSIRNRRVDPTAPQVRLIQPDTRDFEKVKRLEDA
jgi:hypothetical protein